MASPFDETPLYAQRLEWQDLTPVPQYENVNPLAPILYSEQCKRPPRLSCQLTYNRIPDRDATDYFRGIVKKGEMSERVLELTEDLIRQNPAHYSAWQVTPTPPNKYHGSCKTTTGNIGTRR